MINIGKINNLQIVKEVDFGVYLDGGESGEILLPQKYLPENCEPGDNIDVFIYCDSDDRLIATTEKPYAMVGDFVLLKTIAVDSVGAFLDWGLLKDLLVPFREQKIKMEKGRSYVVFVYLDDESQRIAASSKLDKFLDNTPAEFEEDEEVDLLIWSKTDLGYKAIINGTHQGMLYDNEIFKILKVGKKAKGYIKKIREDEKIDLYLQKPGFEKVDDLSLKIIDKLKKHDGFITINDKSSSEEINSEFGVSKKTFKKAVGALYRSRIISIKSNGLELND